MLISVMQFHTVKIKNSLPLVRGKACQDDRLASAQVFSESVECT